MSNFSTKHLVIVAAFLAIAVQAQPVEQGQNADHQGGVLQMLPAPLKGRSIFDEYTLGQQIDGAKIIYTYQHTQSFNSTQSEISLVYDYPAQNDDSEISNTSNVITQITLYVEAADDATTQAYVTQGGIGESSVSLQIVAQNSNSLRYMVIIYGKPQ